MIYLKFITGQPEKKWIDKKSINFSGDWYWRYALDSYSFSHKVLIDKKFHYKYK